jgi:hypothetical protein
VLDGPEDEIVFDDDDLLREHSDNLSTNEAEGDVPISGIVQTYFLELKECLTREIALHKMPVCYQQGHFWIHPIEPYFAMREAHLSPDGLTPYSLYQPTVFIWLPHLLEDTILMCQNQECKHYKLSTKPLTGKGWNDKPIACRVVTLNGLYYIMTQRIQCDSRYGGCGRSMNLYDPIIMDQLAPGLAAAFPAFLTH